MAFLQLRGLSHERLICSGGHDIVLSLTDREDPGDANMPTCRHGACDQQKQLKADTWLEDSHLSFRDAILFIYC